MHFNEEANNKIIITHYILISNYLNSLSVFTHILVHAAQETS